MFDRTPDPGKECKVCADGTVSVYGASACDVCGPGKYSDAARVAISAMPVSGAKVSIKPLIRSSSVQCILGVG